MPTQNAEFFAELTRPFADNEIKTRKQGGREFAYVTSRSIYNRLDEVCGPENWNFEFTSMENSTVGRLSITLPNGTVVTRMEVGGSANMADAGDDEKSSISDCAKRCAMAHGIGRHLWGDGSPDYAGQILDKNVHTADTLGAYLKAQFEEMTAKFAAYCKEQKKKAGDLPTFGDFLAKLTDEVRNFHIVPQSVSAEDCVAKLVSAFNTKARYSATAVERTLAAIKKELAGKLS